MRKIVESTLMSLDGVVNDPGSWALDYFDHEFHKEALELLQGCDAMLMGRGTYEDLSWRWPGQQGEASRYSSYSASSRSGWAATSAISSASRRRLSAPPSAASASTRIRSVEAGQVLDEGEVLLVLSSRGWR